MKLHTVFRPEQFGPTHWDSAETKAKFANHFVTFVAKGFPRNLFTKDFYKRLSMTFGHIAHYNQLGFWEEFFESNEGRLRFIQQSYQYPCYGDPAFTYSDVERELIAWLRQHDVLNRVWTDHTAAVEAAELAQLAHLRNKYKA